MLNCLCVKHEDDDIRNLNENNLNLNENW
jgi:hypothetical protein